MLLDPAVMEGSGALRSCDFWSPWSALFSSSGNNRKGATSARKRVQSNSSEPISEFADDEGEAEDEENKEENEDGEEGAFSHGQHVIFGIGHAGGRLGGVGSGRGESGNLTWRRLGARNKRGGT